MFPFLSGASVITRARGNVRHAIYERVLKDERLEAQRPFVLGEIGVRY